MEKYVIKKYSNILNDYVVVLEFDNYEFAVKVYELLLQENNIYSFDFIDKNKNYERSQCE